MTSPLGPPVPPAGPIPCTIALLAEAPGSEESERQLPLVGPSGQELRRMLRTIGVDLRECFKTNVFSRQPPGNDIAEGYGTDTPSPESKALGPLTSNPTTFLRDEFFPELERLREELALCAPNVIVALGNTACWALGLGLGISNLRGTTHVVDLGWGPVKVLPTYHPADVIRQWSLRTITITDLEKAHAESFSPQTSFDNSELWLAPTLGDLVEFGSRFMDSATVCATDVETKRGQITCVSFSPNPGVSICVPFWVEGPNPHYWPDIPTEVLVWRWVAGWVESPGLVKVMQNGLYDLQYFHRHGIRPQSCTEDTMLLHHSLFCEMRKGLGFLGSIYANVPSWKYMRTFKKEEQLKRDD